MTTVQECLPCYLTFIEMLCFICREVWKIDDKMHQTELRKRFFRITFLSKEITNMKKFIPLKHHIYEPAPSMNVSFLQFRKCHDLPDSAGRTFWSKNCSISMIFCFIFPTFFKLNFSSALLHQNQPCWDLQLIMNRYKIILF